MTETYLAGTTPDRLLLATDFSARCDRALDRAAQLASEWRAELVVLKVLEPAASADLALAWAGGRASDEPLLHLARQQLVRDLSGMNVPATLHTAWSNDAAAAIRTTAIGAHAGMVVTGVSRNEITGRFLAGSTVERLARSLPQPLLVVRYRAHASYQRIVVASDFSASSSRALQAAARLFPGRELILYHADDMPMSSLVKGLPSSLVEGIPSSPIGLDKQRAECSAFLAATGLPAHVKVRPVIERGAVETALTQYVRQHDIDLVVMGTQGRGAIMSLLLGSTAAKLLDWLPCDTLLVREPRANE
ncbi:universal stress protein [Cupriavidus basilensis]|uniref:Universal stress protein n=1 Tax=Cupriavidus basilensis TaxID=68895 RepID=A0ABT6AJC3_9BURK|nr:universal stress protein [Cupriavidus basilensis]MDF3832699.1 universal stress protein [Cupriavidus basilensis]